MNTSQHLEYDLVMAIPDVSSASQHPFVANNRDEAMYDSVVSRMLYL